MSERLVDWLANAKGPDRDLDAMIAVAVTQTIKTDDDLIYAKVRHPGHDATSPGHYFIQSRSGAEARTAPLYTSSIDAALTLVPEYLAVTVVKFTGKGMGKATLWCGPPDPVRFECDRAPTPAIALCIAALKARAAQVKS